MERTNDFSGICYYETKNKDMSLTSLKGVAKSSEIPIKANYIRNWTIENKQIINVYKERNIFKRIYIKYKANN